MKKTYYTGELLFTGSTFVKDFVICSIVYGKINADFRNVNVADCTVIHIQTFIFILRICALIEVFVKKFGFLQLLFCLPVSHFLYYLFVTGNGDRGCI